MVVLGGSAVSYERGTPVDLTPYLMPHTPHPTPDAQSLRPKRGNPEAETPTRQISAINQLMNLKGARGSLEVIQSSVFQLPSICTACRRILARSRINQGTEIGGLVRSGGCWMVARWVGARNIFFQSIYMYIYIYIHIYIYIYI